MKYDSIKQNLLSSFEEFIKKSKGKKYLEYFSDFVFYIFLNNNTGCLVEVEKIWLVEDKIID